MAPIVITFTTPEFESSFFEEFRRSEYRTFSLYVVQIFYPVTVDNHAYKIDIKIKNYENKRSLWTDPLIYDPENKEYVKCSDTFLNKVFDVLNKTKGMKFSK